MGFQAVEGWIETILFDALRGGVMSRPARARGLKPGFIF
jgi:hypothetical protein